MNTVEILKILCKFVQLINEKIIIATTGCSKHRKLGYGKIWPSSMCQHADKKVFRGGT